MAKNKIKNRRREEKTFYKVLGTVADIIMYPVLIVSLLSAFFMLISNRNSSLPSAFGISVVKVMSGSMVERGFEVGDVVFVKKTDTATLKVGDVVAFYKQFDSCDMALKNDFVKLEDYDGTNLGQQIQGRTTIKQLKEKTMPVYFHRIKNIYVLPQDGTLFFETAGSKTENTENDYLSDGYIRSDFIVGKYVNTPRFVRDAMKFCASSTGMICLVVMPLSVLVLLECLSIVEQINNIILENKVFYHEEPYDSKESIKANIGKDMDLYRQIYFYATSPPVDRDKIKMFLWANSFDEYASSKELELKDLIEQSDKLLKNENTIDQKEYFDFWSKNLKYRYQKRRYDKLMKEHELQLAYLKNNTNDKSNQVKTQTNQTKNQPATLPQKPEAKKVDEKIQNKKMEEKPTNGIAVLPARPTRPVNIGQIDEPKQNDLKSKNSTKSEK